jgi:hypothetical protein
MEEWLQEQIKFGRTICLHDSNWEPIFRIKLDKYDESLLQFITSQYNENKHHLLADNNTLYGKIIYAHYYTHFPNYKNPLNLYRVYAYLYNFENLLNKPHWREVGNDSGILPEEIMDIVWKKYYSNMIVTNINNFKYLVKCVNKLEHQNYYIYCLLCWIENNFDKIFTKLDYTDIDVIDLLKYLNCNIVDIKNRNYSFEYKCPQIASLIQKWQNIHKQYL